MRKKFHIAFLAACLCNIACDNSSHTNNLVDPEDVNEESFNSSSSINERLDIDYHDTITIGDTINYYITLKGGEVPCGADDICIDSNTTALTFFLGEYTAGTRVSISMATSNTGKDTLMVKNETEFDGLKLFQKIWDEGKKDSIFSNYMIPGEGAKYSSNQVVLFKDGFYYAELKGKFTNGSHIRLVTRVEKDYYEFTGDTSATVITRNDTLRGIIPIKTAPSKINVRFAANVGYNVDIQTKGKWIPKMELLGPKDKNISTLEQDLANLDSLRDMIKEVLLPLDSTEWNLVLYPQATENYQSGPFATFEVFTQSRKLTKGEYIANADSIKKDGETLVAVRECTEEQKCYIRQEEFVWLGDMKKGDTISVHHEIENYYTNNTVYYHIMNKDMDTLSTLNMDLPNQGYKATADGPVYLHYLRLKASPKRNPPKLTMKTTVQKR